MREGRIVQQQRKHRLAQTDFDLGWWRPHVLVTCPHGAPLCMQGVTASQRAKRAQERAEGVPAAQRYTPNLNLLRDCGEVRWRCFSVQVAPSVFRMLEHVESG